MLTESKKQDSLRNVRHFLESIGEIPECPLRKVNVLVQSNQQFCYHNINLSITYKYEYRDYQVELFWEDDNTQPKYQDLGLHGKYSSNFQFFIFSNGVLSFSDGDNEISIMP